MAIRLPLVTNNNLIAINSPSIAIYWLLNGHSMAIKSMCVRAAIPDPMENPGSPQDPSVWQVSEEHVKGIL